ncbi:endothelin-converting enzyme 1-like [Ornithodoros turicata]|uniref:endothelin-converting enzyme 1-like n=1 Tax=Ornithodoros turicata TaxID=34597 RepID=UPI003138B3E8
MEKRVRSNPRDRRRGKRGPVVKHAGLPVDLVYHAQNHHGNISTGHPEPKSAQDECPSQGSSLSWTSAKPTQPTSSSDKPTSVCDTPRQYKCPVIQTAVLFTFLGAVIVVLVLNTKVKSYPVAAVINCGSNACREYVQYLHESMNETIDPCENFYGYVCGRMQRANSVRQTAFMRFRERVIQKSRARTASMTQSAVEKAALFYQSCENVLKYNDDGELPQVKVILADAGITWPTPASTPDVLFTMLRLSSYWLWDTFITVKWVPRSGKLATPLSIGPSPHLSTLLRQRNAILRAKRYFDYFVIIYEAFKTSNKTANAAFDELGTIERDAVPMFEARLHSDKKKVETTIRRFNYTAPGISRERWFQGFKAHFYDLLASEPVVVVEHVRFLRVIPLLIDKVGEVNLHLYLSWTVVQRLVLLGNSRLLVNYHGTLEAAKLNHRSFCYHLVQEKMGFAFLSPYVSSIYTPLVKNDIANIMNNICSTFDDLYRKSFDPSDSLRAAQQHTDAVLKYLDMFTEGNVDRYYANYSSMTDKVVKNYKVSCDGARNSQRDGYVTLAHFRTPAETEFTFLDDNKGEFLLAPNVLELPYYDETVPVTIKYAAFGSFVAESLTKLLLHTYTEWHANSRSKVRQTIDCVTRSNPSLRRDHSDDLQNLIVAAATIHILLSAIEHSSSYEEGTSIARTYRRFFVIWCYVLCDTGGDSELCNGPLRHVDEFASVFGCAKNSSMRSELSCKVFSA